MGGGGSIAKKPKMEHGGDKWTNVWNRERQRRLVMIVMMQDQALMVLSPSPLNSILNISPLVSIGLIVVSVSCVSVNCVVVVVRKTIGPFERVPFPAFEGIEYDIEWELGRVSSELIPRPIRTMISEN
jgi:hypothetical protein